MPHLLHLSTSVRLFGVRTGSCLVSFLRCHLSGTVQKQRHHHVVRSKFVDIAREQKRFVTNGDLIDQTEVPVEVLSDGSAIIVPISTRARLSGQLREKWSDQEGRGVLVNQAGAGVTTDRVQFHAAWLWTQDPTFVHATSGQRTRSLTTLFANQWRIRSAFLMARGAESTPAHHTDTNAKIPYPPPFPGSMHPVSSMFGSTTAAGDQNTSINHSSSIGNQISNKIIPNKILLCVEWIKAPERHHPSSTKQQPTEMVSYYDIDWLTQCRYDESVWRSRHEQTVVTPDHAIHRSSQLVQVSFNDLFPYHNGGNYLDGAVGALGNKRAWFELLQAVLDRGAALVVQAPASSERLNTLQSHSTGLDGSEWAVRALTGGLSGGPSHGRLYGDLFHVQAVTHACNVAYTNEGLPPHQDLAYYESPPGLQLLHCWEQHHLSHGGQCTLIDVLAAAHAFRDICPDLFHVLASCPATFVKQRVDADMVYRRPHIQVEVSSNQIASVRWAPPFEGPLCLDQVRVPDYFVARAAFECLVDTHAGMTDQGVPSRLLPMLSRSVESALRNYAQKYTWEQSLQPGQILVLNNLRMLHGRRAFGLDQLLGGCRHLVGAYTNIDDTLNVYRILRRKLRPSAWMGHTFIRNVGNGSTLTR